MIITFANSVHWPLIHEESENPLGEDDNERRDVGERLGEVTLHVGGGLPEQLAGSSVSFLLHILLPGVEL